MKKKLLALLAALALLAGCAAQPPQKEGGGVTVSEAGGETAANIPLGRYVEEAWELPPTEAESAYITRIKAAGAGFDLGVVSYMPSGVARYHSDDGKAWEKVDAALLDAIPLPEGADLADLDWDENGYVALSMRYTQEGDTYIMHTNLFQTVNGVWQEVPIDWDATRAASGSVRGKAVYAGGVTLGPDGSFYFADQLEGIARYTAQGALRNNYPIAWNGTRVGQEILGVDDNAPEPALVYYDLESEQETQRVPIDTAALGGGYPLLFAGEEDIYLAEAGGIWHLAPGGTLFEQMVNGATCSLGKPALGLNTACASPSGAFLVAAREGENNRLLHYRYDAGVPSRPEKELVVAGLYNQPLLHQASIDFQVAHPDVAVAVKELYDPDSAMTPADALRSLNTELLAGKGPDLLVLDHMPLRSYEEKGVLLDIGDLAQGAGLLENVALSLQTPKGLFAVPGRMEVPLLVAEPQLLAGVKTLGDLAALAQKEPGTRLFYDTRPAGLLYYFFPACYPSLAGEGGTLDEAALAKFLTDIKALSQNTGGADFSQDLGGRGGDEITAEQLTAHNEVMGAMRFAYNKVAFVPVMLREFMDFRHPYAAMLQRVGTPGDTLGYVSLLPGLEERVKIFYPQCILGVNKAGDTETARQFIALALSQAVQQADLGGLPVHQEALRNSIDRKEGLSGTWKSPDGSGEELHTECTPAEAQQPLLGLFEQLNTPVLEDETLSSMLLEEAQPFFEGGATAEQAAQAIVGRMASYLAE